MNRFVLNNRSLAALWSALLLASAASACQSAAQTKPTPEIPFAFPDDDGNFRVTGDKRVDVVFPLASTRLKVCTQNELGPKSLTRYRSMTWHIAHRNPADYMELGAHEVTVGVQVRLDSVTVLFDSTLTFEQRLALARDSTFARFDSAISPTGDYVRNALRKATVSLAVREGEPPMDFGGMVTRPVDIQLRQGRLSFSIDDVTATRMLVRPDNVSVTMSWCGDGTKPSKSQSSIADAERYVAREHRSHSARSTCHMASQTLFRRRDRGSV